MQLTLDRHSRVPLYQQIRHQIREMILSGRLPPGTRLPAERALAAALGVNRTTVVNAYRELQADGLVEAHVGRGTTVCAPGPSSEADEDLDLPLSWSNLLTSRVRRLHNPLIQEVARLAAREGIIRLATGVPTPETSPVVDLQQLMRTVVSRDEAQVLRDSPTEGLESLREALASRLAIKGCHVSASRVLILSGSQQGLDLVARLLLEPGDVVIVEAPTYLGALRVFRAAGARLIGVPVDEAGMRVDLLEPLLARYRPRLIYTIPTFQNPTGVTLSPERRQRLLSLARRFQVPILEDDSYGDLYYDETPPAPLLASDRHEGVLYLGSFSALLGPGLRLGWLLAPTSIMGALTTLKQMADLHPGTLVQVMALEVLRTGRLDDHLEWARHAYARRRDAMEQALRRHAASELTWEAPQGGFYYWCRLPDGIHARDLLREAADEGVVFVPGEVFFPDGGGESFLRLNFSYPTEAEIEEGVRRLARAIRWLRRRQAAEAVAPISVAPRPVV
ncbi:MAG TPA: PLP-dependent aminotransferase family protein [Caldilineae bacterium]|nr:PLP-dependent aminotransferase family protein [Caldilineae bacterium]